MTGNLERTCTMDKKKTKQTNKEQQRALITNRVHFDAY